MIHNTTIHTLTSLMSLFWRKEIIGINKYLVHQSDAYYNRYICHFFNTESFEIWKLKHVLVFSWSKLFSSDQIKCKRLRDFERRENSRNLPHLSRFAPHPWFILPKGPVGKQVQPLIMFLSIFCYRGAIAPGAVDCIYWKRMHRRLF